MSSDRPVAIVSGAARGIGAASAQRLAARGYTVALIDLPTDPARLHTIPGPYRHATGAELDIATAACGGHGDAHSADVRNGAEIDHVVALADAWYKGARSWDPQRRLDFANDPRNLLAVSPKANFDKAFRDAASWLPPNEAFRCDFVARQIEVKAAYGLWLSAKEKKAMESVLSRC